MFSLFVYLFLPLGLGGVVGIPVGDYGSFYVGGPGADRRLRARRVRRDLPHREPDPRDEHVDGRRRSRPLRDRPRRHDDQVALPLEQVSTSPARGMTGRHGGEHRPACLLLGANNFVILYISNIGYVFCSRARAHRVPAPAEGPSGLAAVRSRPDPCPSQRSPGRWPLFNLILVLAGVLDQIGGRRIGFYEFKGLPALPRRSACSSHRWRCSSTGGRSRTRGSRSRSEIATCPPCRARTRCDCSARRSCRTERRNAREYTGTRGRLAAPLPFSRATTARVVSLGSVGLA